MSEIVLLVLNLTGIPCHLTCDMLGIQSEMDFEFNKIHLLFFKPKFISTQTNMNLTQSLYQFDLRKFMHQYMAPL